MYKKFIQRRITQTSTRDKSCDRYIHENTKFENTKSKKIKKTVIISKKKSKSYTTQNIKRQCNQLYDRAS